MKRKLGRGLSLAVLLLGFSSLQSCHAFLALHHLSHARRTIVHHDYGPRHCEPPVVVVRQRRFRR